MSQHLALGNSTPAISHRGSLTSACSLDIVHHLTLLSLSDCEQSPFRFHQRSTLFPPAISPPAACITPPTDVCLVATPARTYSSSNLVFTFTFEAPTDISLLLCAAIPAFLDPIPRLSGCSDDDHSPVDSSFSASLVSLRASPYRLRSEPTGAFLGRLS